jgi:3-dehydroquinate synthase
MIAPHIVTVDLAGETYPVMIGSGLIKQAGPLVAPHLPRRQTAIVTDEIVARLHLPALQRSLDEADVAHVSHILPAGEKYKNWQSLEAILDFFIAAKIERTDAVIALGGGVVGDMVGFAAAILRRGCRFIQIPTTLLAQVDSSVGGKTAINMPQGKNLVGAFHQPALVLADTLALATLPRREMCAGFAEVVKYGLINDAAFFGWCEQHGDKLLSGDADALTYAIEKSVAAKAAIVAQDETETLGIRALLNLGHTFGHAFEAETGFSDRLLHGEAVAIGMVLAFQYSAAQGICPSADARRIEQLFAKLGMKNAVADITNASGASLVAHMLQDKKRQNGTLPFLLARGIGKTYLDTSVDLRQVAAFLDKQHQLQPAPAAAE